MKKITFKIATEGGLVELKGELIKRDGFRYALHKHAGMYKATELSTGMSVCKIDEYTKTVDGIPAREYLIQQIEKHKISQRVLTAAVETLSVNGIEYPVNSEEK